MPLPLDGIRVIEFARYQAGPRCGMILGDLGADVIKIERPGGEEGRENPPFTNGMSHYWVQYNRGKKSITLNLRHEKCKQIVFDLVKRADVVTENFRPGVIAAMGFGYDVLKAINPRIVMLHGSAYGQYGPYRERPGFDPIGQAISGHMSITGFPECPPVKTYTPIIDRITALHGCIGVLAALRERELSGEGQEIDVCLADTGYTIAEIPISHYLSTGIQPQRRGNRGSAESSPSNIFRCSDGYVFLTAGTRDMWRRLCRLIGKEEWIDDARFQSRESKAKHASVIEEAVNACLGQRTRAEAVKTMSDAGLPIASVNTIAEAAADPHLREREMMLEIENPKGGKIGVTGRYIKFSRTPTRVGPIPLPGQHNEEVLGELLGYGADEIEQLRSDGVI